MTPIKHVIFDLDGTLIDSAPGIIDCFRQILAARNLQLVRPLDQRLIGPPLRDTLQTLTGIASDDPLLDILADEFKRSYDSSACQSTPAYPGITSALEAFKARGIGLHIATNKRIVPTRVIVECLGWNALFTSVNARDSYVPPLKTKADLIQRVLLEQQIDARQVVYVGDTREDELSAKENRIPFWAALWGYGQLASLEQSGFSRTLPATEDLVKALALHG